MAEYNYPLRRAVWGISLTAALVLAAGRAARNGADRPGPADHAAGSARARVKAHFEQNFTIV